MRMLIEARGVLLARLEGKRPVELAELVRRVVTPTLGHPDEQLGRSLARLVNRDPSARIRVTGLTR